MNRFLSTHNIISMLLLVQHVGVGLSFGYVACTRNCGAVPHSRRVVRLMAEPTSSSHQDRVTPINREEEGESDRLSKRKRLKRIVRRFRSLPSSVKAKSIRRLKSIKKSQGILEGTPDNDDVVQKEERKDEVALKKSSTHDEAVQIETKENSEDEAALEGASANDGAVQIEEKKKEGEDGVALEVATDNDAVQIEEEKGNTEDEVALEGISNDDDDGTAQTEEITTDSSRQSRAAVNVDLSGTWRPIVTPEFKKAYDSHLVNCGQPYMFRKIAVNGIVYQKEIIRQLNGGVDLEITASNPAGNWERTLVASDLLQPLNATITDPDGDKVKIEAWWEENGTRHKSILREKPAVQGGVFETVRYLETDNVLVCESKFISSSSSSTKFKDSHVVWSFERLN